VLPLGPVKEELVKEELVKEEFGCNAGWRARGRCFL
jgi:hypothetical protein